MNALRRIYLHVIIVSSRLGLRLHLRSRVGFGWECRAMVRSRATKRAGRPAGDSRPQRRVASRYADSLARVGPGPVPALHFAFVLFASSALRDALPRARSPTDGPGGERTAGVKADPRT